LGFFFFSFKFCDFGNLANFFFCVSKNLVKLIKFTIEKKISKIFAIAFVEKLMKFVFLRKTLVCMGWDGMAGLGLGEGNLGCGKLDLV